MARYIIMIVALFLCIPTVTTLQAESEDKFVVNNKAHAPTITVTKLDISDKTLKLGYEIRNDSDYDIWICEDISLTLHQFDFEAYMAEDKQTLLIRRRLDITPLQGPIAPPHGRYVRLRAGQSRPESLFLSLPVESRFFWASPTTPGKAYAKNLALEIGYYPGDMPGMIRGILEKAEKSRDTKTVVYPTYPRTIKDWFGSLLRFNRQNWPGKLVRHRGEEVVIPWTVQFRMRVAGLTD